MRWLVLLAVACDGGDPPLDGLSLLVPAEIAFDEVTVGATVIAPLPIENPNPTEVRITGLSFGPDFTGDQHAFDVQLDLQRVAPGETVIGRVTFFSRVELSEALISSFTIETNSRPSTVRVRGRTLKPALRFDPERIDFGVVALGGAAERTLSVTSLLARPVVLSDRGIEHLGGRGRFELDANITDEGTLLGGRALLEGESAQLLVRYVRSRDPSPPADRALVKLSACDRAECEVSLPISASAEATALICAPVSIDFGAVRPGDRRTATIDCVDRTGTEIDVSPSLASDAFLTSTADVELAPYEQARFEVEFAPNDAMVGMRAEGVLTLESDQFLPVYVPLSGEASRASIRATPARLEFGRAATGTRDRRRVAVSNEGESALRVKPSAPAPFGVDSGQIEIAPGATAELSVWFEPPAVGVERAELQLSSNDPDRPLLSILMQSEGIELAPCDHRFEPALDFGSIELPRRHRALVKIENAGPADCLFKDFEASPPFSVVSSLGERMVASGDRVLVELEVRPAAGSIAGELTFYASAPGSPPSIDLLAEGKTLGLAASPSSIEVGEICARRTIDVFNASTDPIEIMRIDLIGDPALSMIKPEDLFLDPGERQSIAIDRAGSDRALGRLELRSTAANLMIPLSASPESIERFTVPSAADVLFVIDADAGIPPLGSAFAAFLDPMRASAIDWQAGVITADSLENGCPGPPSGLPETSSTSGACGFLAGRPGLDRIITPDTMPSPEQAFALLANVGSNGRDPPTPLAAAAQALSNPILTSWNAGFVRHEAALLVVIASKEDASSDEVDRWLSYLRSLELEKNAVIAAALIPCSVPAPRLVQLAQRSGGIALSLCSSDPSAQLAEIAELITSRATVLLDGRPDPSSIQLEIDGAPIDPAFYLYDASINAIALSPVVRPGPGAEVLIRYLPLCL